MVKQSCLPVNRVVQLRNGCAALVKPHDVFDEASPFICQLCRESFRTNQGLRGHMTSNKHKRRVSLRGSSSESLVSNLTETPGSLMFRSTNLEIDVDPNAWRLLPSMMGSIVPWEDYTQPEETTESAETTTNSEGLFGFNTF